MGGTWPVSTQERNLREGVPNAGVPPPARSPDQAGESGSDEMRGSMVFMAFEWWAGLLGGLGVALIVWWAADRVRR